MLPSDITVITVTDTYSDMAGNPVGGHVSFVPTSQLTDATGNVVFPLHPVVVGVSQSTGTFTVKLPCTDNAGLAPPSWAYVVEISVPGMDSTPFTALFPSTLGSSVQLRTVAPIVPPAPPMGTAVYSVNGQSGSVEITAAEVGGVPAAGGTMTGQLTLTGSTPLQIPAGAATGDVLTSDASGNASWSAGAVPGLAASLSSEVARAETAEGGLASNLSSEVSRAQAAEGGNATAITTETARAEAAETLALQKGNNLSDVTSASSARTNLGLTGAATASLPLALGSGGTGQTTQQASLDSLAGATTSGNYLRGNGTHVAMSALQAGDLTGTVAIANGGTGSASRNFSGLLTETAVKTSAYTAAAGDFVCVDTTSGAITITLPNAPADLTVVAVKLIASAATPNAVTIACAGSDVFNKTGGSTSATLTLLEQSSVFQYQHSTGIWLKQTGDVPLARLDSRYGQVVFSPVTFGAKGDRSTDDTTAVQAAFAAAATWTSFGGGVVDLQGLAYKTTSPITLVSNTTIRGGLLAGAGAGKTGEIINTASDCFSVSGSVTNILIQNCTLASSGGHVFNCASGASLAAWNFLAVGLAVTSAVSAIFYMPSAGTYIDMLVGDNCTLSCVSARPDAGCGTTASSTTVTDSHAVSGDAGLIITNANIPPGTTISSVTPGTGYVISNPATATASSQTFMVGGATISPWYVVSNGNAANSNTFRRLRINGGHSSVPFFHFENQNTGGYNSDNVFEQITAEQCDGGILYGLSCRNTTIDNVGAYDTATYIGSLFYFSNGATYPPSGLVCFRNSGRRGGALAAGCYDLFCDTNVVSVLIDNGGPLNGPVVYSAPATQTWVRGAGIFYDIAPGYAAAGVNTGANAASRYAGATASGHPTTGTFILGDWVVDQSGAMWVCTSGGTPGSWVTTAGGAPTDPLSLGQAQNFLPTMAGGGAALATANQAYYSRLLAGGYAISNIVLDITVSSGNICVAAYTGTTSGASAAPTGGQLATSTGVLTPAVGVATISLGATVTPKLKDWWGISCDNSSAAVFGNTGITNTLMGGMAYLQASAYPLPGTPTVSGGSNIRIQFMKGS